MISSWAFPHGNHWPQVCSPHGFQPLFLCQHWPYFQYILLQVLQNHLGIYDRALIIPLVHVQPGFQVRRTKDDWQTFSKAITKACKTWVFCSGWQYDNFSITFKKSTYIRCSLKRSILITCCLVHQQCNRTSSKLGSFSTWCTLLRWGELKMVDKPFEKRIRRDGREEGLQGKHYCFSSTIHMQLRPGIKLPSGLSELHSCTEKVH